MRINNDLTVFKTQTICNVVYVNAKVNGFYGWYSLEPVDGASEIGKELNKEE